jgi:extracellular matrix regulatory protein A
MAKAGLLNIGFGNFVAAWRVTAIVNPTSSPMRRLREDARAEKRLIDATQGRKTRAIIITDSNHVILSGIQAETLGARLRTEEDEHAA